MARKDKAPKVKKEKKSNGGLGKFFFALVMAIVVFIALIVLETGITQKYEKQAVVIAKQEINANVDITQENLKTYFTTVEKDVTKLSDGVVKAENIDTLVGGITKQVIPKGQEVTSHAIDNTIEITEEIKELFSKEDLQESSLSIIALADGVAGTLRRGDIVDVSVYVMNNGATSEDSKMTVHKVENVFISHAYDGSGVEIKDGAEGAATMFKIVGPVDQITEINEYMSMEYKRVVLTKTNDVTF